MHSFNLNDILKPLRLVAITEVQVRPRVLHLLFP